MKIRAIIVLTLIACGIVSAISYVKANRVSTNEKAIIEAIQTKNTPALIQSLITRMKNQLEKDADTFPELIKEIETYAGTCPDSASVAVLHSMIAEMYNNYYMQNRWNINQRTELAGYVPDDIREWTSNLFKEKIKQELRLSLQPAQLLQQTPVSQYNLILKKGKDMPQLRPTLYDFLAFRAIDIQPSAIWYKDLIAFRRTQPDKKALLLDELDYWQYKYDNQAANTTDYRNALDSLYKVYEKEPFAAEIRIASMNLLQRERYQGNKAHQDSIQALIYTLCKESIAQYPQYDRINIFKNQLNEMETPVLNIQSDNNVYPGKDLTLQIKYVNTPQLVVRIYKSLRQPEDAWRNYYKNSKSMRGKLVKEVTFKMDLANSYTEADSTLTIPMDQLGLYEYVITVPGRQLSVSNRFSVSRLAALTRSQTNNSEVLVTDLESGKPIEGATVIYYKTNMMNGTIQRQGEVKTDRLGIAVLPAQKKIEHIRPVFREDTSSIITNIYPYGTSRSDQKKERVDLSLFTDRGIYRPGQNVFFKGIAYVKDTDNPHVVAGRTYTVTLRDANYKEVASKEFKTDRFGSFNGEFTIPAQTLSGNFTLVSERTRTNIRVEEYKRPTFKVSFLPIQEEVSFGHPVKITGEAQTFSGIDLQTGEVNWTITRRPFWARFYMPDPFDFTYKQVANGTAKIDNKGNFTISFVPERPGTSDMRPAFQSYEVTATLTDSKGETQEASYTFSVGDTGILLDIQMPGQEMESDSAKAVITAYTVNRQKASAEGSYTIYSLSDEKPEKDMFGTDRYKINKLVAVGTFITGDEISPAVFRELPAGRYRLEVKSTDSNGKEVSANQDFILYNRRDKRPPVFMHTWLIEEKTTCAPGEEAAFIFGTSDKDTHIVYEVYSATNKCIERKQIRLSDENRTFRIPFKETDGEGFTVSFTFVKDGKAYVTQVPVYRRQPDRRLTIQTETFRDHLLPGSKENWKFRITDADSASVSAEVLASMYDASLDKLLPFKWSFSPKRDIYLHAPRFSEGTAFTNSSRYETGDRKGLNVPQYQYDRLDWQGVLSLGYRYGRSNQVFATGAVMKSAAAPAVAEVLSITDDSAPLEESAIKADQGVANIIAEEEVEESGKPFFPNNSVELRENFAETAFFYPALVTDEAGDVAFSFTMPESNTTWKLQLLAQTEDLKYGYLSREIITNKPLMVTPNLPRFLRQGDEVTITTQISNQSSATMNGRASLELFDPDNDQPVICLTKSQKPFTLGADSTTTVSWSFKVPASAAGVIGCRIVADSDKGSDGEQHLIPVLSNEILVTESTPFYLFDKSEEVIRLKDNKGIRPFRTTLELTANPIWYAVQALPTLTQPENDNVISWFASYYSNTLASYIATAHPRIQQVISQWKAQGGNASTLYSNLEKNAELKNILLQETPWVLEADNETEQKQRLSLLFDLNRAAGQREIALRHLLDLQTPDGGWGWFKGMYPSQEITLYILKGMNQLTELNAVEYNQQEKEMQIKALTFVDKQIQSDYEALQKIKNWQKNEISPLEIEYLFVRSQYRDIPELGSAREAIRYYTNLAEKQWSKQSIYGKGEIAWLMWRNGKKETAGDILVWLRKTASTSADKGMYWANNRRGENFFVSPIDTHCLLMALFNEVSPDKQKTDRMKQWLLSQKQTQNWESVPATVNAIYALLLTGSDWLDANNTCTAKWGKQTYSTTTGESATGYLKVTVSDEKRIASEGNTISIRKEGAAPAWGAVYEQYFQNINDVKKQKGILNVEKKLFVETNNGTEQQLRPVTPDEPLRIGDKVIVRLVVRTDREMDYVFLKDLRAGCFEPAAQLSGSVYRDGVGYYQSPTDVSENFFFDRLPQGTFVLEYAVYVSRTGEYAGGISTIQCLYAPEFVSHTEGNIVKVD
ncbi:alpha-2-macroglobulin family protein [Parabacteroides sp.]